MISIAGNPNGGLVAAGGKRKLSVWETDSSKQIMTEESKSNVLKVAWLGDDRIGMVLRGGTIQTCELSQRAIRQGQVHFDFADGAIDWSYDGKQLAFGGAALHLTDHQGTQPRRCQSHPAREIIAESLA